MIVHIETTHPLTDEHAHRPDLMERLYEIGQQAEAQGIDLDALDIGDGEDENWRDYIDLPEAVKVTWAYDTDNGSMHPVAAERA